MCGAGICLLRHSVPRVLIAVFAALPHARRRHTSSARLLASRRDLAVMAARYRDYDCSSEEPLAGSFEGLCLKLIGSWLMCDESSGTKWLRTPPSNISLWQLVLGVGRGDWN
ncbi:hypothetical protein SKAU_G00356110 [Synaphobranchus kaupii]|uniref:Uncharacterized protein n=1 Tax=Synaphobranchus kaupii TaxID=118154 RepID=A0A9Q1EHD8_SYNKA|nr:hypothetical protein SKAU_G00356110 [Synaphobranchus kaupii]